MSESDYDKLITKLHNFCINCSDNSFMQFVWVKTIQRIEPCDEENALKIIDHFKKKEILKIDGKKLTLNKNIHRNMKYINV
jgi:hypothetical protein